MHLRSRIALDISKFRHANSIEFGELDASQRFNVEEGTGWELELFS